MAQWLSALSTKADSRSLIPRTHISTLKVDFLYTYIMAHTYASTMQACTHMGMYTHRNVHAYTHAKNFKHLNLD